MGNFGSRVHDRKEEDQRRLPCGAAVTRRVAPVVMRFFMAMVSLLSGTSITSPFSQRLGLVVPWRLSHTRTMPRLTHARLQADDVDAAESGSLARPINRYVDAIQNIPAPELIEGFASSAPSAVQQAVRATIVSLLGKLPPHLYDVNVMSTGQNLASLMFSMQMTGYMFRNAEYRRSLLDSLAGSENVGGTSLSPPEADSVEEARPLPPVTGKIKLRLSDTVETEVEASAYMAELRRETMELRRELAKSKKAEAAQGGGGGDLLTYLQGLGREDVGSLTSSISEDVLGAMRTLIENILSEAGVGGESFMETSGLKLRELLVWQLVTGYKLRQLEVSEELGRAMGGDER